MPELSSELIGLFEPPSGYQFRCGVVLTHNCNWSHVTDLIVPTLAGCDDRSPLVRRRAALGTRNASLLVVADAAANLVKPDASSAGESNHGPAHTWARLARVRSRRQHAKLGVLEFVSTINGKRRLRAYVTSANLTPSGTSSNHELVIVDEVASTATRPSLVKDVTEALWESRDSLDLHPSHAHLLQATLREVRRNLKARPTHSLVHSLDHERDLTVGLGAPSPADRITIVSPAFAADGDREVAKSIAGWTSESTTVSLITQCQVDGKLRFSRGAYEELQRQSRRVDIREVPRTTNDNRQRTLHAKLIGVVHGTTARVVVGSANFSSPGLLGRNREAVVAISMSAKQFDVLLDELPTKSCNQQPESSGVATPSDSTPRITVVAQFVLDPSVPIDPVELVGRLHLDADSGSIVRVEYAGTELPHWREHPVVIQPEVQGTVTVTVRVGRIDHHVVVPIEIEATREQLEEWPQRDGSPEPDLLERLLGTIRGTARRPRKPQPPGSKGSNTPVLAADDRYVIPLEQRLVLLARYRHQVAAVVRAYWFAEPSRLSNLLSDDELPRALALFGLQDDGSELLSSLGPAADALDQRRAGQ